VDGSAPEAVGAGLTPTQTGKLFSYDHDLWLTEAVDIMAAAAPDLTNFREIKLGDSPIGTATLATGVLDAAIPGGGLATDTNANVRLSVASLFQTAKTTSWAFAAEGLLPTSTAGHFNMIGLETINGAHDLGVATFSTNDATHYILYSFNGTEKKTVSTVVCDDAFHRFVVTFDGTTVTLWIDGVSAATLTDLAGISDENLFAAMTGVVAGSVKIARYGYGYISPTAA
jgi:hypothetical protein